jgi:alpha-tubulin suppressor-like RCC1 family protein
LVTLLLAGLRTVAQVSPGSVVAWGTNSCGQLDVPTDLTNAVQVSAGGDQGLALRADGAVTAWGRDDYGEADVPADVTNAVQVVAGAGQCCAIDSTGALALWGESFQSFTNGLRLPGIASISFNSGFLLALKRDGTVISCGPSTPPGLTNFPPTLSHIVAVAAGGQFGVALREDASVVAWGADTVGQTNMPANLTNVVAIAAGYEHGLALRGDGTVAAWGHNLYGLTNVPAGLSNVLACMI